VLCFYFLLPFPFLITPTQSLLLTALSLSYFLPSFLNTISSPPHTLRTNTTYIHYIHTLLRSTTYIHYIHTLQTYTTYIHYAHTLRTYTTYLHYVNTHYALRTELMRACFDLEKAICPHRMPSATIAINRHAQFRPHR
jgi:hypothetical protein